MRWRKPRTIQKQKCQRQESSHCLYEQLSKNRHQTTYPDLMEEARDDAAEAPDDAADVEETLAADVAEEVESDVVVADAKVAVAPVLLGEPRVDEKKFELMQSCWHLAYAAVSSDVPLPCGQAAALQTSISFRHRTRGAHTIWWCH